VGPADGEAADAGSGVAAAVVGGGGEPEDVGRGEAVAQELLGQVWVGVSEVRVETN
jgi:hypothetical protein